MAGPETERQYEDGRHEWRRNVGSGWTKYTDDHGNQGFEQDLGQGNFRRGDRFGRDNGTHIQWGDGSWERKWDK
jgi:hypothetical protein